MDLTQLAIEKNRVTTAMLVVALLGGLTAFNELPRAEDPGFIIRTAQVITHFPGASPERVENLVTDRLEQAIREIPELDSVESTSKTGISIIIVNIKEKYREMRPIWDSLRRKIEREAPNLPAGALEPTVNDEFGDVFGIVLSLTGDGFSYAELEQVAENARDELLQLPDVAKVDTFGIQEERIFIEYENARLTELGIAPSELSQVLEAQNIVSAGGTLRLGPERIGIEPSGNFESVGDLRRAIVQMPDSDEVVYLEDLVQIRRGYVDPPVDRVHTGKGAILYHSRERTFPFEAPKTAALVLAVSMREGGQVTALGVEVEALMRRFNEFYPIGLQLDPIIFQPTDVQQVVDSFVENLLQAIVVVMLAMLAFLGLRTGLVISALIPTAIMTTLLVMQVAGIGLDQISLAALIIALGMLVDNGVVMAESMTVGMAGGQTGTQAAIHSARELRVPLLTASLTTSAAFLPIYLAESATGEYTASLFTVVTIALLSSWLLSLTMTPMLGAFFLKVTPVDEDELYARPLYRAYRRALEISLRARWLSAGTAAAIFFGVMWAAQFVPSLFFPPSDRPSFEVEIELPAATDVEYTREVVEQLERHLTEELLVNEERPKGIVDWVSFIGRGAPRYYLSYGPEPQNPAYAILLVNATSHIERDEAIRDIQEYFWERHPEVKAVARPRSIGPPVSHPIQIRITAGFDQAGLFEAVESVKSRLRQFPTTRDVGDDWGLRTKKLRITVDQAGARRVGASSEAVALSLKTLFTGLEVTQYREGDKIIPVTMRSKEEERLNLSLLETANVYLPSTGEAVPLSQIATAKVVWEPSKVLRRNAARTVSVVANVAPGALAMDVTAELFPWLEEESKSWPLGMRYTIGGEDEASSKANSSIGEKMPIGLGIILLLLILQFNSFRKPVIILLTVPLGPDRRRDRAARRALLLRLHDAARCDLALRHRDQQRHRADRPHPDRDRGARAPAGGGDPGRCPDATATDPADDGHDDPGARAALPGRRPDVGADGDRHHVRSGVLHVPHVGCRARALRPALPRAVAARRGADHPRLTSWRRGLLPRHSHQLPPRPEDVFRPQRRHDTPAIADVLRGTREAQRLRSRDPAVVAHRAADQARGEMSQRGPIRPVVAHREEHFGRVLDEALEGEAHAREGIGVAVAPGLGKEILVGSPAVPKRAPVLERTQHRSKAQRVAVLALVAVGVAAPADPRASAGGARPCAQDLAPVIGATERQLDAWSVRDHARHVDGALRMTVDDSGTDVAARSQHGALAAGAARLEAGVLESFGKDGRAEVLDGPERHAVVAAQHRAGQRPVLALVLDSRLLDRSGDVAQGVDQRGASAEVRNAVGRREIAEPRAALAAKAMRDPANLRVREPRAQHVESSRRERAVRPRAQRRESLLAARVSRVAAHLAANRIVVARLVAPRLHRKDAAEQRGHRHLRQRWEDGHRGPRLREARQVAGSPEVVRQLVGHRVDDQEQERSRHLAPGLARGSAGAVDAHAHPDGMMIGDRASLDADHLGLERVQAGAHAVAQIHPVEALRTPAGAPVGIDDPIRRLLAAQRRGGVHQPRGFEALGASTIDLALGVQVEVAHQHHGAALALDASHDLFDLSRTHPRVTSGRLEMGDTDAQALASRCLHFRPEHALALEPVRPAMMAEVADAHLLARGQPASQREPGVPSAARNAQRRRVEAAPPRPPQLLDPDQIVGPLGEVRGEPALAAQALPGDRPGQAPQVDGEEVELRGHDARS